eukprot:scaffold247279_cov39-Attheya_sp.AAC.1
MVTAFIIINATARHTSDTQNSSQNSQQHDDNNGSLTGTTYVAYCRLHCSLIIPRVGYWYRYRSRHNGCVVVVALLLHYAQESGIGMLTIAAVLVVG